MDICCPCGWGNEDYDRRRETRHAAKHLQWDRGLQIPDRLAGYACISKPNIVTVRWDAEIPLRKLAYDMARLAQRSGHYDFPSFTYPVRRVSHETAESQETAYLYWTSGGNRSVGYVVVDKVSAWGEWKVGSESRIPIHQHDYQRSRMGLIWVANGWRRQGIASAMVRKVAETHETDVAELVWQAPFTDVGLKFAQALVMAETLLIG